MPLREHLVEIRKRLFLAAIGIVLGAVVGWIVYEPVLQPCSSRSSTPPSAVTS